MKERGPGPEIIKLEFVLRAPDSNFCFFGMTKAVLVVK